MMEKRKARAARGKELFLSGRESSASDYLECSSSHASSRDSRFLPLSLIDVLPVDLRPRRCERRAEAIIDSRPRLRPLRMQMTSINPRENRESGGRAFVHVAGDDEENFSR